MILGNAFARVMLSTSTGGVVMIYLLFFLVPVALLAWAARVDWKRRRREISGHDINTAAYTVRQDAQGKANKWNALGGGH